MNKREKIEAAANLLIDYTMEFAPENGRWLNVLNEIRSDVEDKSEKVLAAV